MKSIKVDPHLTKSIVKGLIAMLLFAFSFAGQTNAQTTASSKDSIDYTALVTELIPAHWKIFDEVKRYTPESLYEIINGGAELYLAYDVVALNFVSLINKADSGQYIELSIYDMGSPINAFGIFSVERPPGMKYLNLGRTGYQSDGNYYIWQGRYYILVVASDNIEELNWKNLAIASKVAAVLPDSGERVWGLTAFPKTNLVPDSIKYFKVDAMGLDFLRNTYTATYKTAGADISVFLSVHQTPQSAGNTIAKYREFAGKYGKGVEPTTRNNAKFILCKMGSEFDVVFQNGKLVGGVTAAAGRELAIQFAAGFQKELSQQCF